MMYPPKFILYFVLLTLFFTSCKDDEMITPLNSFVVEKETVVVGDTVKFFNLSEGYDTYSWDFGDGQSSTDKNPVHVYDTLGVYTVALTTENSQSGDRSTVTKDITIIFSNLTMTSKIFDIDRRNFFSTTFFGSLALTKGLEDNVVLWTAFSDLSDQERFQSHTFTSELDLIKSQNILDDSKRPGGGFARIVAPDKLMIILDVWRGPDCRLWTSDLNVDNLTSVENPFTSFIGSGSTMVDVLMDTEGNMMVAGMAGVEKTLRLFKLSADLKLLKEREVDLGDWILASLPYFILHNDQVYLCGIIQNSTENLTGFINMKIDEDLETSIDFIDIGNDIGVADRVGLRSTLRIEQKGDMLLAGINHLENGSDKTVFLTYDLENKVVVNRRDEDILLVHMLSFDDEHVLVATTDGIQIRTMAWDIVFQETAGLVIPEALVKTADRNVVGARINGFDELELMRFQF